jgi:DNA-binding beta-propeller fold protein YncE
VTRHLNKHIDYAPAVAPPEVNQASLGIPTDRAVSADGSKLYLAAFGSQSIAIIDTAALALDPSDPSSYQPSAADHVALSAGGPGGVVIDGVNHRLYVYTRFDDGVSVVDPYARAEVSHVRVQPRAVGDHRQAAASLYDTHLSSSNGEASCGVCHVFGDFDSPAWDLARRCPTAGWPRTTIRS